MAESDTQTTTDPNTIHRWATERNGVPATVKGTSKKKDPAGVLRIHFPDQSDAPDLEEITWGAFFEKLKRENLAFLYQEKTKEGDLSRFFKIVSR
jgi:hypothetical protein